MDKKYQNGYNLDGLYANEKTLQVEPQIPSPQQILANTGVADQTQPTVVVLAGFTLIYILIVYILVYILIYKFNM